MKTLSRHAAFAACSLITLMPPAALAAGEAGELCSDAAIGVATDRDGRTLVVGSAYDNRILEWESGHAHYGDLAISRLLENGAVDDSFAEQGTLLLDVGDFDTLTDVIVRREGIYSGGTTAPTADDRSGDADLVVLALTETGRRRRGFGARGVLTLDLGGDDELAGLAAGPDGALYVAGTSSAGGESDGFVLRLRRHGELDTAFGDLSVSRDGVTVAGWEFSESAGSLAASDALVARYGHDGILDESFGDSGVVLLDFHGGQRVCGPAVFIE